MNSIDTSDLHPETRAIVEALVDSSLDNTARPGVDEDALARFACGWVTVEERDEVVSALTASRDLRERLLQMTERLREAETGVEARQRNFQADPTLRQAMESALRGCASALARWGEAFSKGNTGSEEERRSLRSVLMGIGKRLEPKGTSFAYATARGAGPAKVLVEPGNVFAELDVRVDDGESLVAHAHFSQPFPEPREVSLYVVEQGGAWSWIGSNLAKGADWNLETPEYASMLGLDPGELNAQCFALSEGRWFMPRGWVALRISEELHQRGISSPTRLRLRKPPSVQGESFVIGFELPAPVRETFANDRLTLSVDVGSASFVLGAWAVKELPSSLDVELVAPSLGIPDGEFQLHSAINLMLRSPE